MLEDGPPTDIWSTGFSFESPLKDLLDTGSYTVEQLLAEDELLQELRGCHPQLVEFFSTEEAVVQLVRHVFLLPEPETPKEQQQQQQEEEEDGNETEEQEQKEEPPSSTETNGEKGTEKKEGSAAGDWMFQKDDPLPPRGSQDEEDLQSVRYPYMACEVICSEINSIIDIIVDGYISKEPVQGEVLATTDDHHEFEVTAKVPEPILDLVFSILYDTKPGELDDYRAGYFDKILSVLCRRRPQAMSDYINEGGGKGRMALMNAMLKHLYSHSILQVAQRLLLPIPPLSPPKEGQDEDGGDEEQKNENNDDSWPIADEDDLAGLFRCRWSEYSDAVDILLNCLIGTGSLEAGVDEELRLSEAQNASEVLITMIQNSPLTSPTLITLTTDPIMERITRTASELGDGQEFVPHDSSLTGALNVLESLVLQLGGYGTVGTVIDESEAEQEQNEKEESTDATLVPKPTKDIATPDTLLKHLPRSLESFCRLLRHPSTETWLSPTQFSKEEPQPILGTSRLRIVRLIESLVLLGNADVDQVLCDSNCLAICLELFWEFEWCSMLHQSVANLLVHVFEGANARATLQEFFLSKCDLLSRLIDCFEEPENAPDGEGETEVKAKETPAETTKVTKVGENGKIDNVAAKYSDSDGEVLPVSDDDVDAALEREEEVTSAVSEEKDGGEKVESAPSMDLSEQQTTVSTAGTDTLSHIPSLRKGYMGHVIIICQALVHACTTPPENDTGLDDSVPNMNGDPVASLEKPAEHAMPDSTDLDELSTDLDELNIEPRPSDEEESYEDSEAPPSSPLIIAHLIHANPMRERWHEFVTTTLASETAIQSTPLGGFDAAAICTDPLMPHRPPLNDLSELYDDDDDDDDNDIPVAMGKGLSGGGDVLDMDDNDIEVAASMMDALSLPTGAVSAPGPAVADESGQDKPDFGSTSSSDYMFDDPLGANRRFDGFDGDSDSSSDEEEDKGSSVDTPRRQSGSLDVEPPVMDLFAGNFANGGTGSGQDWSDFANFDDAFAAATSPSVDPFVPPTSPVPAPSEIAADASPVSPKEAIDDIFGSAPHALLLDDPVEAEKEKLESGSPEPQDEELEPTVLQET